MTVRVTGAHRAAMLVAPATAAALLLSGTASAAPTPVAPPTDRIVIDVVTVNGTGCPLGTTSLAVSPDNTAFTLTYSNYLAQVGVGARRTDFRKNCQLNLRVHVPQGFTYGIAQADYRGFAHLEPGAIGTQLASYYFQGDSQTLHASHPFHGPMDANWQSTDQAEVGATVFAPCGEMRNLNINTELRVNAGTSDPTTTNSFMSMDSTDGSINTVYHFSWLKC